MYNIFNATGCNLEDVERLMEMMDQEPSPEETQHTSTFSASFLEQLIRMTIAVQSLVPEQKTTWEEQIRQWLAHAVEQGTSWEQETELFTTVLDLLVGKEACLPADHPYSLVIEAI